MKINKYLSSILRDSTPLAMLPEAMDKFLKLIQSADKFDSIEALKSSYDWEPEDDEKEYELFRVVDGVAIIEIKGAIFGESNCATMLGMGVANTDIQAALELAKEDNSIKSIILDINSPGGEVAGTADTANLIKSIKTSKPIYAYVSDMAASAAYWIAANCTKIIISETASLGSIGVRAVIEDNTKEQEMLGIKSYTYLSSQSPKKDFDPKNAEIVQDLQNNLDFLASIFINSVAIGRGVSFDMVVNEFGQGGVFYGVQALSKRMADEIGTLSGIIKSFSFSQGGKMEAEKSGETITAEIQNKILESERGRVAALLQLPTQSDSEKSIVEEGIKSGLSVEAVALKILTASKEKNAKILAARENDAKEIPAIASAEPAAAEKNEKAEIERMASLLTKYNKMGLK